MNNSFASFDRLQTIATQIGELTKVRATINIRLSHLEVDLNARKLALTPLEGWEGKNAEQRTLAEQRTIFADVPYAAMFKEQLEKKAELLQLDADVEALVSERRALEWQIRAIRLEIRRLEFGLLDQREQPDFDDDGLDDQEDDLFADDEFSGSPIAEEEEIPF